MNTLHHLLLALVLGSCSGCGGAANEFVPPPPPTVRVARPVVKSVVEYVEENGQTEAAERAVVSSRVQGFIEEIKFKPGQPVAKDDVLYLIEKDRYEAKEGSATAALAAAVADIAVAKAQVETAKAAVGKTEADFMRQDTLMRQKATSQAEYDAAKAAQDAARASLTSYEAQVKTATAAEEGARANLASASLDLRYTTVLAPISGKVTKTDVKLGNLVAEGTELATIVNDEAMFVNFSVSDRKLLQLTSDRDERNADDPEREAGDEARWRGHPVFVRREIDKDFKFAGTLDYVDQEGVDPETGTLGLRGRFDNPDNQLVPGLFVRVRVPITQQDDAILIPERATSRDQLGAFVLAVDAEGEVRRADVSLGQKVRGWVVVVEGLSPEDEIIVDGLQRAQPGSKVKAEPAEFTADELPPDPPPLPKPLPAAPPAAPAEAP